MRATRLVTAIQIFVLLFICGSVEAQPVYTTPAGAKYHLASCRMVKNTAQQTSITAASAAGLQPCKLCRPASGAATAAAIRPSQGQGESVQCKGTTRSGNRCRHYTRMANAYCFQHQS
ncbi:MAG: hypothetical protein ABIU63_09530 [Chitinophagaceae bacterium]